jgi:hypothetical protein
MLHSWMDSRMAEEHRRELTSSAAAMVASWNDNGLMDPDGATDHLAAAAAAPGPLSAGLGRYRTEGGLLRRPFGQAAHPGGDPPRWCFHAHLLNPSAPAFPGG